MTDPFRVRLLLLIAVVALLAGSGCERDPSSADDGEKSAPKSPESPTTPAETGPAAPVTEADAAPTKREPRPIEPANPKDYAHPEDAVVGVLPEGVGLAVGETVPDFTSTNSEGKPVTRDELVAQGPLLVVFYRGGW